MQICEVAPRRSYNILSGHEPPLYLARQIVSVAVCISTATCEWNSTTRRSQQTDEIVPTNLWCDRNSSYDDTRFICDPVALVRHSLTNHSSISPQLLVRLAATLPPVIMYPAPAKALVGKITERM